MIRVGLAHLQRGLERGAVEQPAPDDDQARRVGELRREDLGRLRVREDRRHPRGQLGRLLARERGRPERGGDERERHHRRRHGLRRRHGALLAGLERERRLRRARERARSVVRDREARGALGLHPLERAQDLGRPPRLAHRDREEAAVVDIGAVERVQARRGHRHRPPAHQLEQVAPVRAGGVRRPARDDDRADELRPGERADLGDRAVPPRDERREAVGLLGHLGRHALARHRLPGPARGPRAVRGAAASSRVNRASRAAATDTPSPSGQRPPFSQYARIASSGRPLRLRREPPDERERDHGERREHRERRRPAERLERAQEVQADDQVRDEVGGRASRRRPSCAAAPGSSRTRRPTRASRSRS